MAYINACVDNFTSQEGTGSAVNHCLKLYLNIAKYEPLKGSSYLPLPNALANKKSNNQRKNVDNKCLMWALLSLLYPDDSHHKNEVSRYRKHTDKLNLEGIVDFPSPVSQIQKSRKTFQFSNKRLWLHGIEEDRKGKQLSTSHIRTTYRNAKN